MYNIIKNVVQAGNFELSDILKKIDVVWLKGDISDEQRSELIALAQEKATPQNSLNLIKKIEELKEAVGIKKTIADYGVDEKYFLETLDDMCEKAFDDQCTGANPRYPLISEIKEMFLKAYYGK